MMAIAFSTMKEFEGHRVRMRFDDGLETIARLLSAVEDMDGSHHLIYDEVEWSSNPVETSHDEPTLYAEGDSLLSIEAA